MRIGVLNNPPALPIMMLTVPRSLFRTENTSTNVCWKSTSVCLSTSLMMWPTDTTMVRFGDGICPDVDSLRLLKLHPLALVPLSPGRDEL